MPIYEEKICVHLWKYQIYTTHVRNESETKNESDTSVTKAENISNDTDEILELNTTSEEIMKKLFNDNSQDILNIPNK